MEIGRNWRVCEPNELGLMAAVHVYVEWIVCPNILGKTHIESCYLALRAINLKLGRANYPELSGMLHTVNMGGTGQQTPHTSGLRSD